MTTMIDEFIDYSYCVFPSIDTNIKNGIKTFLSQFDTTKPNWFSTSLEKLSQGDILDNLPFTYVDNKGVEKTIKAKGMILSNSCDLTRDKYIVIAPMIPLTNHF